MRRAFSLFRNVSGFTAVVVLVGGIALVQSGQDNGRSSSSLVPSKIVGSASVIDGDTLEMRGRRIRLHGIDAPEGAQLCEDSSGNRYRCGQGAALALADKIRYRTVSCQARGSDRYGRTIGLCEVGGEDLNGWLVSEGLAVAYLRYSLLYLPRELVARLNSRGLWAGKFVRPEEWRAQKR